MKSAKSLMVLIISLGLIALAMSSAWSAEESVFNFSVGTTAHPDPHLGGGDVDMSIYINHYDTLVGPLPGGKLGPYLAEKWDMSSDGLTYTFYLRKGVQFHDGTELTAEDVAFSMKRVLDLQRGMSFLFRDVVKSAKAIDKYTVRLELTKPSGPFLSTLIRFYVVNKDCCIENKKSGDFGAFGDYGTDYLMNGGDCGSGAYILDKYVAGAYLEGKKFPKYYHGFAPRAPDRYHQTLGEEPTTLKTMMKRRELDLSPHYMPIQWYKDIGELEGVTVEYVPASEQLYLMINTQGPPTDDIHVRKALSWVFDYQTLVKSIYPGNKQAIGPIPRQLMGHNPELFQYRQDFKKAEEELKKSRYYGSFVTSPFTTSH